MVFQVFKSQVGDRDAFAARVEDHAKQLTEWRAHMAKVGKDPRQFHAYPAPTADPLIAQSIHAVEAMGEERWEAAFEYVDDGPTAQQMLLAKQNHLIGMIQHMETAAKMGVVHPAKLRLQRIRYDEILRREALSKQRVVSEDQARRAADLAGLDMSNPEHLGQVAKLLMRPTDEQFARMVTDTRGPEDLEVITSVEACHDKYAAIEMHAAVLMDQVSDLTVETIDEWKPAPFPSS